MLDINYFRSKITQAAQCLRRRGYTLDVDEIQRLEGQRSELQQAVQTLQAARNRHAKLVGQAKAQGQDIGPLTAALRQAGNDLDDQEAELKLLMHQLHALQLAVPNIPHETVPDGKSEAENQVLRHWGTPRSFDFVIKDHVALGEGLSQMDLKTAATISGARFTVLQGGLARLQRALGQFMLNYHTREHGYQECYVPALVNTASLHGTGQLPKFSEDLFQIGGDADLWLIPTGEVPLTNLWRGKICTDNQLPLKYVAQTTCFRSEAGAYGKDTHGMIRQHQFEKVELVQFVKPEDSYQALESLTADAEKILQLLGLPYRVVALCAGDLGFSAAKTYDLEVWLPSQTTYREISSCSNFEAFQARRIQARFRDPITGKPTLLHTLNGSGLAIGRTLVAIMENYQDAQGRIHIPEVLQPLMQETVLAVD